MMSTAQDYRKGLRGSQTHASQATLGERAIVFTQHPGYRALEDGEPVPPDWNWQKQDEPGPGYWTGNGAEPRSAQHENVVIQIFAPQYEPVAALRFGYIEETHAYFPHAHFDEVVQAGNWTFGRKDDGYVALYSLLPTEWRDGGPEVFENGGLPFDLVAAGGSQNVWITECGSAAEWGSFEVFRANIEAAVVTATPVSDQQGDGFPDGHAVVYESPSQGRIEFDWNGPLVVGGLEVPIAAYARYDNPFVQAAFGDDRYEIERDGQRLTLDFATNVREVSGVRPQPPHAHPWWSMFR